MRALDGQMQAIGAIQKRREGAVDCLHCGHDRTTRGSTRTGVQRMRCESCRWTFSSTSCTAVAGNGPLEVGENMADVGGVTLASDALRLYLADQPEEDVTIDGLAPQQRCFLSWAQMWTSKSTDELLRTLIATDPHPADSYRAVAPLQHLDAFYEAFDIGEGDQMWLPPESRVDAW